MKLSTTDNVKEPYEEHIDGGTNPILDDTRRAGNIHARKSIQAIVCSRCSTATIAEHDTLTNNTILYNFEPYLNKLKVKHRHPCNAQTRVIVLERVATEKRLLEDVDPNDYLYTVKRKSRKGKWNGSF